MSEQTPAPSPKWSPLTKTVVGLTLIGIVAALLVQFRAIIGPLILAFILTYLLYPVAASLSRLTRLSWRASVSLIYLLVIILYLGLITAAGVTIIQQLQSLYTFINQRLTDLPTLAKTLSTQVYQFGPFQFSLAQFDLEALIRQLLSTIQPLLGRMGALLSGLATSVAVTLGRSFFVLIISYFILADANRFSSQTISIEAPGYEYDIRRLSLELRKIWNAYLRGQLIIILLVILAYSVLMVILGVRFAVGIAILAGLARFVPYVGPLATAIVTFLVALFQGGNYFGLQPYQYAILVVAAAFILDQVFDNMVSPRILGDALGVHPAAVLIGAIVAANLIGVIGLVLAAPVLASLRLLLRYLIRKMFDLNPWPEAETRGEAYPLDIPWKRWMRRLKLWVNRMRRR
jgi:predicted PurR-regulated permease PerM